MRWKRISIYFVRGLYASLAVNFIELWLSQRMVMALAIFLSSSSGSCFSQISSQAVDDRAMYSASVLDIATIGCRLLSQQIADPESLITYPVHERLLSIPDAQSASEY